jgi:hypothetical protein
MSRIFKILAAILLAIPGIASASLTWCDSGSIKSPSGTQYQQSLPFSRSAIPPSLADRRLSSLGGTRAPSGLEASNLECGVNAMCASFSSEQSSVTAWIGFPYQEKDGEFFIATYGQRATHIGNGVYATPLWDKRHFWIKFNQESVPYPLQSRYIDTDADTGHVYYSADYVGYRLGEKYWPSHLPQYEYNYYLTSGGDPYELYPYGASISSFIIEMDPATEEVVDYWIDYYDSNADYIESFSFDLGDKLGTYFLGFQKVDPDYVWLFSIEDIAEVTQAPEFSVKNWVPGKDFSCTYCDGFDISQVNFYYMFEAFTAERWSYTDPLPVITAQQPCPIDPDAIDRCNPADTELLYHEVISGGSDRCITDQSLSFSGRVDQDAKLLLESNQIRLVEDTHFKPGSCVRIQAKTPSN